MEYTRDLGYCAVKYLMEGGNAAMITMQGGNFVPIPFKDLIDPVTGRTRVRMVDIDCTGYGIARRYMLRLRRDDFADPDTVEDYAATCGLSVESFRQRFEPLVAKEPGQLKLV